MKSAWRAEHRHRGHVLILALVLSAALMLAAADALQRLQLQVQLAAALEKAATRPASPTTPSGSE